MQLRIPAALTSFQPRMAGLYLALWVSGFSALVYESTWGRMLQRVFGVSDLAVATVLATFFLGLGLGSALAARWVPKLTRPALTYAALESAIGAYAFLSLYLIPRVHDLYASVGNGRSFEVLTAIRLLLAMAILLPPTCLMGATLPVLVAAVSPRGTQWETSATRLYFFNTAGAVFGAGATGFWIVPTYGARASILIAAAGSFIAGMLVLLVWTRKAATAPDAPVPLEVHPDASAPDPAAPETPWPAMVLAALAGFTALAGEVLWTRVLRIILQGTTQAFAAMLVNYLAGIAIGSLAAERIARRSTSPNRDFAVAQLAVAGTSFLALMVTPQLPRFIGILQGDPDQAAREVWVIGLVSAVLLLPLALAIGAAIPLAWRVAGGSGEGAAANVGKVLAANTLGGLFGSLTAGFLLVPSFGIEFAILVVLIVNLAIAGLALRRSVGEHALARLAALAGPLLLAVPLCLFPPSIDLPYLLLSRYNPVAAIIQGPGKHWHDSILYLREGRNTTVTITQGEEAYLLCNDGRRESGFAWREPGFGSELALLGALPTFFAAKKESAMVIGLGAGHTTTMLLAGGWDHVEVVELEEAVEEAARALHKLREKPFPLDDPRAHCTYDDARAQLVLSPPASYDAVVSQPSQPWLAGSSALYTEEFFLEVRRALREGGVFALWINLFRMDLPHLQSVIGTLVKVFPHVQGFVINSFNLVLCAGDCAQPLDATVEQRFAAAPNLAPILGPFGIHGLTDLVALREIDDASARALSAGAPILVDDRPVLEFDLGRLSNTAQVELRTIDIAASKLPWLSSADFSALPADQRIPVFQARIQRVWERYEALHRVYSSAQQIALSLPEKNFVEGAMAEAVGDVPAALKSYDASDLPAAATAADELRAAERQYAEAIRVAAGRKSTPTSATSLLRCAAAMQTPEAIRTAVQIATRVGIPETEKPVARFLTAFADGGRKAAHALADEAAKSAEAAEEFAYLAHCCAIAAEDLDSAGRFLVLYERHRAETAAVAFRRGCLAEKSGNLGAAIMYFRRVLAENPGHAPSAVRLATALCTLNKKLEANQVLQAALAMVRGIPENLELLVNTAVSLGLDPGVSLPAKLPDQNPGLPDMEPEKGSGGGS